MHLDIMTFARVWTGAAAQVYRTNLEAELANRITTSDPWYVEAKRHDIYPKTDLTGGYLGDGYLLCSSLPEHSFLAQGAQYEFLGYDSSEPVFIPNITSQLVLQLCGATDPADCKHARIIDLTEAISCKGKECDVQNLQVVKIGSGYYEFVSTPLGPG